MATRTTKTTECVVYVGKCPKCGKDQSSEIEGFADKVCNECMRKADAEKFRLHTNHLIGAKIIDVAGGHNSSIRHSSNNVTNDVIESVTVATSDGRQFVISGEEYAEGDPDLVIEEVVHPIEVERDIEETMLLKKDVSILMEDK